MIIPPLWLGIYSCYEIVILSYMGLIDIGCPSDALLSSYRRFKIRCGDLRDSLLNHINKPSSNHVIIRLTEDLFTCPNICARFSFPAYFFYMVTFLVTFCTIASETLDFTVFPWSLFRVQVPSSASTLVNSKFTRVFLFKTFYPFLFHA